METTKKKNEVWEWAKAILIAFSIAAIIRFFLFTPIVVDGESMMPTLRDGDRMVVNKIGYDIGTPERFEIVVFHAPEQKNYIKRIIGLPGDSIAYEDDQLYINGEAVDEPYLDEYKEEISEGTLTEDFTLEERTNLTEIPEGYFFVMGDNRRYSKDSRIIGLVPEDEIIGTTSLIFWPLQDFSIVK
ncbi:signal peptidase I [Chryseomicrobium sp. FSL W7-1435]|uniref:signal peptidase I n=1 Tax=Chryseomicrobium sp. FSL W7-1435 TaxID=2921704 RepID=UPI00315A47D8